MYQKEIYILPSLRKIGKVFALLAHILFFPNKKKKTKKHWFFVQIIVLKNLKKNLPSPGIEPRSPRPQRGVLAIILRRLIFTKKFFFDILFIFCNFFPSST